MKAVIWWGDAAPDAAALEVSFYTPALRCHYSQAHLGTEHTQKHTNTHPQTQSTHPHTQTHTQAVKGLGMSVLSWAEALAAGAAAPAEPVPPSPDDYCTIMYTRWVIGLLSNE